MGCYDFINNYEISHQIFPQLLDHINIYKLMDVKQKIENTLEEFIFL